jgi:hypothetical protein
MESTYPKKRERRSDAITSGVMDAIRSGIRAVIHARDQITGLGKIAIGWLNCCKIPRRMLVSTMA